MPSRIKTANSNAYPLFHSFWILYYEIHSIADVSLVGTHKEVRSLGENSAFEKLNYFDFFK